MLIAVLVLVALVILGVVAYIGGEKNVNNASKSTVKRQEKNEVAKKLAHAENLLENWANNLMPAKKTAVKKTAKKAAVKKTAVKKTAKKAAVKKVAKKAAVKKVAKKAAVKKVAKKAAVKKVAKKTAAKKTTKR
jgi:hypothetical protein